MTNKIFKIIVSAFCLLWITKNIALPLAGVAAYSTQYMELSSSCGSAMNETWFAEQLENNELDKSSQIELLVCHNYDLTRKKMLSLGIPEEFLSYLGLRALELGQDSAERLVEQHRFRER
ncbi:TIGR03982 family His-Xaa-Ser system protein [Halomonas piscis]|uniref:TIGR03982 family His-Xaa-Ser system protein n=1 Tax=Halomonas piscis TaxID=3031727 RepID=UPI002896B275|nr:TIGR03982 family His-Xaa-Ser system protein [Halomonas piscis]